jgi:hypothetical protein
MTSAKRDVDVECEVPAGKRAVPDFGGDVARFEEAKRALDSGEIFSWGRWFCAVPGCYKKVLIAGCLCHQHQRKCGDCECLLMTPSALRYVEPDSPHNIFWRSAARPVVCCSQCIKNHNEMPVYGDGVNKHPVVLFWADIGATGTSVATTMVAISDEKVCSFCWRNLYQRARTERGDVAEVGGVLFCGDCVGINRTDCGVGVKVMGSISMCTVAVKEVNDYGALTGKSSDACLTCRKWRFNGRCTCAAAE